MFSNDHIAQIFPDGIITVNADGRIVRANAAAETMLGWSETEMSGALIEMVIPGDGRANPSHVQTFGLSPGGSAPVAGWRQIEMQRRDGSHCPVQVWLAAQTHGEDRNTTIVLRDMSELACRETEAAAALGQLEAERAHNELLALVAEHASDVFIITDAKGVTVWVNKFTSA